MSLLNHTTTIPLARTLAEIAKAIPVPVTFEREHGRIVALSFRYAGELYRLSPNVEGAWKLLNQAKGCFTVGVNGHSSTQSVVLGGVCFLGSRQSSPW
ncbi:MAG: hypothetical protein ACREV4_12880 [Gammaproteobacteria bacterium]